MSKRSQLEDAFSDLVEAWHEADTDEPIHKWIGLTPDEYSALVESAPRRVG